MAFNPLVEIIDVAQKYGIVADGVTDNATNLMRMQADCAGTGKPFYVFLFPSNGGTVLSSNNRFLYNVSRFRVEGNGCTFQTLYSGSDELLVRPFSAGTMFQTNTLTYVGTKVYQAQYLLNSVTAGSNTVTCTTAAQAGNFSIGQLVFIYGFDQIGNGYPPGARYFEWRTVTSVNSGTGVIGLDMPTKNTYLSTWFDTPSASPAVGPARIVAVDRSSGNYCRQAEFNNVIFGPGSSGQQGNLIFAAKILKVTNSTCLNGWTWASENEYAEYDHCNINNTEWDKLVGKVLFKNSQITGQNTGGFGCEDIEFENVLLSSPSVMGGRYISYKNVTCCNTNTNYPLGLNPGFNPTRKITLEKITVTTGGGSSTDAIQACAFPTFTVGSVSGTSIQLAYGTTTDTNALTVFKMEEGRTRLHKSDGTKAGYVTSITNNGTNWIIAGTWPAPVAAELWVIMAVEFVIDNGGHRILDTEHLFEPSSIEWQGNQRIGNINEIVFTQADYVWTANGNGIRTCYIHGKILSVELDIQKIGQFTSGLINLQILTPTYKYIVFNIMIAGQRKFDKFNDYGIQSLDSYDATFFDLFTNQIEFEAQSVVGTVPLANLPEFVLKITWVAP